MPVNKESLKSDKCEKFDDDKRRSIPYKYFSNWLQGFCIYASVLCDKFPEKSLGLFQHIDIIQEAYKGFSGYAWFA